MNQQLSQFTKLFLALLTVTLTVMLGNCKRQGNDINLRDASSAKIAPPMVNPPPPPVEDIQEFTSDETSEPDDSDSTSPKPKLAPSPVSSRFNLLFLSGNLGKLGLTIPTRVKTENSGLMGGLILTVP
jgi:hypothetical protein